DRKPRGERNWFLSGAGLTCGRAALSFWRPLPMEIALQHWPAATPLRFGDFDCDRSFRPASRLATSKAAERVPIHCSTPAHRSVLNTSERHSMPAQRLARVRQSHGPQEITKHWYLGPYRLGQNDTERAYPVLLVSSLK